MLRTDQNTVCPGSSDPFYIVSYYIKWVTNSWTHSTYLFKKPDSDPFPGGEAIFVINCLKDIK